ncbi:phosphatase PAP2 family protein [Candidatus Pacearchaeota archaeon]|nr:phosphatase PAP2 family protein [Candidatus Pacearchaeota archaeon]
MLIDITTNTFMQSIQTPALTIFSEVLALIFDPINLIALSLIVTIYLYIKSSKKQGIIFGSAILLTGILIKLSKEIFQRARPLNQIIQETSFSFPSGHSTMAIVFFGLIIYLFSKNKSKKIKITSSLIAILIIILIGFTRVYLNVHWLTDIFGGFILGGIILILTISTFKNFA